jgi:hypothetical protein
MGNKILNKRGQSTLETVVILVMMLSLLMGITQIWLWTNRQIVRRQVRYNNTRLIAGQSSDWYLLPLWGPLINKPTELKEEDVLLR